MAQRPSVGMYKKHSGIKKQE